MVIEILSISCSVLLLVKADDNHLAVPNLKKSKWLNAKIIVTQRWYISIESFFKFYTLLLLVRHAMLTGLFLLNFKITHCKNHFDTNLVKIHSAVIEMLSFPCSYFTEAR